MDSAYLPFRASVVLVGRLFAYLESKAEAIPPASGEVRILCAAPNGYFYVDAEEIRPF